MFQAVALLSLIDSGSGFRRNARERALLDQCFAQQAAPAVLHVVAAAPVWQQSAWPKLQQTQSSHEVQSQSGHPPEPVQQQQLPAQVEAEEGVATATPAPVRARRVSAAANRVLRDMEFLQVKRT